MDEIFKTVPEFEDYQVSNLGTIISNKKGKRIFLKPQTDAIGYKHVRLYPEDARFGYYPDNRGIRPKLEKVHRLVAQLFIPKPSEEDVWEVNHIDSNKENNAVTNLEWVTRQENITHSWKSGNRDNSAIKAAIKRFKPVRVISPTGEEDIFQSRVHAALYFRVRTTQIHHFIKLEKKVHKGAMKGYLFLDAPEIEDTLLFKQICNIEEKLLHFRKTFGAEMKLLAKQRREKLRKRK